MIIKAFYYDPCIRLNSVVADTNEGLYLLRERGIVHLSETPASPLSLNLRKERRLFNKSRKKHPDKEHLSELSSGYASEVDTIFFLKNGAAIQLMHRNFNASNLHDESVQMKEATPLFLSATEAEELGILENTISTSPFYSEIDCDSPAFAEPADATYIVYPGCLLRNESYLFPHTCLQSDTLSVDFTTNYFYPPKNPILHNQLWRIPALFCSLTHADFDHDTWNSHAESDSLPDYETYAFSLNNECIAEMICVDTFCEPGYFPYHDTFTLTLNYLKKFDPDVKEMIHLLMNQYENIIPVPSHLCIRQAKAF